MCAGGQFVMAETGASSPEVHSNGAAVASVNGHISGAIKWFDAAKGYGFIVPFSGQRDVFLHVKELRRSGIIALNDGAPVSFKCNEGPKGPFATEIKVLPGNGAG